jgi:hypothetical protein
MSKKQLTPALLASKPVTIDRLVGTSVMTLQSATFPRATRASLMMQDVARRLAVMNVIERFTSADLTQVDIQPDPYTIAVGRMLEAGDDDAAEQVLLARWGIIDKGYPYPEPASTTVKQIES